MLVVIPLAACDDRAMSRKRTEIASPERDQIQQLLDTTTDPRLRERLGLTVSAVTSAAFRLRRRCEELIRAEITRNVASADDVEEEIAHLLAVLRG